MIIHLKTPWVEVWRGELKVGEVLPVKVVFDPQGMEGAVEKSVQVDLNRETELSRSHCAWSERSAIFL